MVILHIEANRQRSEDLQSMLHGLDADLYQSPGIPSALATLDVLDEVDVFLVSPDYAASIDTIRSAAVISPQQRVAILHGSAVAASLAPSPAGCYSLSLDQPDNIINFISDNFDSSTPAPRDKEQQFGDYLLLESIGLTDTTEIFRAHQESIDRMVTLEMLKPEYLQDSDIVNEFRAMVRAKAALVHPHVVPVYDALETDGVLYFTTEHVQGMPLPYFVETGQTLSEKNLINLIGTVAETMAYLHRETILHRSLQADDIYLDQTRQAHISNLAVATGEMPEQADEITRFVVTLRPLASRGRVLNLLQRMGGDFTTWDAVLEHTKGYQDEMRNLSAYQRTETESLVIAPLEKKRRRRRFIITGLLAAAGLSIFLIPRKTRAPKAKDFNEMIRVRPGEFIYQNGEVINLSGFWISEYQVTIAQYAEFLAAIVGDQAALAHPSQPPWKKNFQPADWDAIHLAARQGGIYQGQSIDLNCPVFNVDWWDASAYARWRGYRLPTEQEWEKAARGEQGNIFPWGNDPQPQAANTRSVNRTQKPEGYGFWTPVDYFYNDTTPTGIKGLAGNVEEWTETVIQHPDYPDRQVPVVRGGSFASPPDNDLTRRRVADSFKETAITRGFRTVSDMAPF